MNARRWLAAQWVVIIGSVLCVATTAWAATDAGGLSVGDGLGAAGATISAIALGAIKAALAMAEKQTAALIKAGRDQLVAAEKARESTAAEHAFDLTRTIEAFERQTQALTRAMSAETSALSAALLSLHADVRELVRDVRHVIVLDRRDSDV